MASKENERIFEKHELKPFIDSKPSDDVPNRSNDNLCGILNFHPPWLQRFATPIVFAIVLNILGIIHGSFKMYFVSTITTLERRFSFSSKTSGILMIADNLSPAVISVILGYIGNKFSRPKIIAMAMLGEAVGCVFGVLPYLFYGPGTHLLQREISDEGNATQLSFCYGDTSGGSCESGVPESETITAVCLLFVAIFLNGFGGVAYFISGTTYLDDFVKRNSIAMYLGVSFAFRSIGPIFGFLLGSVCLNYYENPSYDPQFSTLDSRWIGAWWLGYVIIGVLNLISVLIMLPFPKTLHNEKDSPKLSSEETDHFKIDIKEIGVMLKRLVKNPLYVCQNIAIIFWLNGFLGYFSNFPKYIQFQFRKSASSASIFSGLLPTLGSVLGVVMGGAIVHYLRPKPRTIAIQIVVVGTVYLLTLIANMFFGCNSITLAGSSVAENGDLVLENSCNSHCSCTTRVLQPVCGGDAKSTYFSPCFAGCPEQKLINNTILRNCSCLQEDQASSIFDHATNGYCDEGCDFLIPLLISMFFGNFICATCRVGSILLSLRCVHPEDRNMALGIMVSIINLLGVIPYPAIYGAVIDSTCQVWGGSCGKHGSCWWYELDKFRYSYHLLTIGLVIGGIFSDSWVIYFSGRVKNFYDDPTNNGDQKEGSGNA